MKYHLAQLNIARFRLPMEHPNNKDFVDNLDKINAIAEQHDGFIWRMTGDGNDALDIQAFDDPDQISNLSLWADLESLSAFVYRNKAHRAIMRRRTEWFDTIDFHLVLWWVPEGDIPTLTDAIEKLRLLSRIGPSEEAFTFKKPFPSPCFHKG